MGNHAVSWSHIRRCFHCTRVSTTWFSSQLWASSSPTTHPIEQRFLIKLIQLWKCVCEHATPNVIFSLLRASGGFKLDRLNTNGCFNFIATTCSQTKACDCYPLVRKIEESLWDLCAICWFISSINLFSQHWIFLLKSVLKLSVAKNRVKNKYLHIYKFLSFAIRNVEKEH